VQQQKLNPEIGQPAATVSEVTTTLWLSKNRPMIMIMIMIMMIIIIIGPATDSTKFLWSSHRHLCIKSNMSLLALMCTSICVMYSWLHLMAVLGWSRGHSPQFSASPYFRDDI